MASLFDPRLPSKFWDRVALTDTGCWIWKGQIVASGYGHVYWEGKTRRVHRVTYEVLRAPIPQGLQIDHLCRVRACVNPDHLEAVTAYENTRRSSAISAENMRKTHCLHGHALTPDNLDPHFLKKGKRICRTCHRRRGREWHRNRSHVA
jgi:hypothetical protein